MFSFSHNVLVFSNAYCGYLCFFLMSVQSGIRKLLGLDKSD